MVLPEDATKKNATEYIGLLVGLPPPALPLGAYDEFKGLAAARTDFTTLSFPVKSAARA